MNLEVVRAGFLTTVQDLGRTGFRRQGVSTAGALDPHALRVANLLVGNEPSVAGLELTFGTVRLRAMDDRVIAWCGGEFEIRVEVDSVPPGRAARVAAGEELVVHAPERGGRAWLAISGGVDVPQVLGSRSTDLRSQFGGHHGRSLRDGDSLPLGQLSARQSELARDLLRRRISDFAAPVAWANTARQPRFLRTVRGAEHDSFTPRAQRSLLGELFTVARECDRMGARLDGPTLARAETAELLSKPVAPGTIQVPPDGHPILLLGDCQTVGGYPKIAHVITVDLPIAAQLQPGEPVRFGEVTLAAAQQLLAERERDVAWFRTGLDLRFPWT